MPVRNWRSALKEKVVFESADGAVYNFSDTEARALVTMTGWGIPPIGKATTHGPFQHGVTPISLRVPARRVTMTIHNKSCDRDAYWQSRAGLVDVIRYNRGGLDTPDPGHLIWYRSDGTIRELDVILAEGPNFTPLQDGWANYSFEDVLIFEADNPIIYSPTVHSQTFLGFECSTLQSLVFGFTFGSSNITFGENICSVSQNVTINYVGNWHEFPTIQVTGPASNFSVTHVEFGWKLALDNYDIAAGETVTFDLTYGRKRITNNASVSLLKYLSSDSNIGQFSIQPDPLVAGGANHFVIDINSGTTDTSVIMSYQDRYIGI